MAASDKPALSYCLGASPCGSAVYDLGVSDILPIESPLTIPNYSYEMSIIPQKTHMIIGSAA